MSNANNITQGQLLPVFKEYQSMHKNTLASLPYNQMGLLNIYQGLEVDFAKLCEYYHIFPRFKAFFPKMTICFESIYMFKKNLYV